MSFLAIIIEKNKCMYLYTKTNEFLIVIFILYLQKYSICYKKKANQL